MTNLLDLMDGKTLRDLEVARVDEAEPDEWKLRADRAIEQLAARKVPFQADDVRALVGDPEHPNAMGGRLLSASRKGLIIRHGFEPSKRPGCHAHMNPTWIGKDWQSAMQERL